MRKGIVFDIQRFSIHDGPGIRTTVFLKGCPLRCIWCHNPESWQMQPQWMQGEVPKLSGKEMTVTEVMQEVSADQTYYRNSGGGLTVSGGEPLLQADFLLELLQEAKQQRIHTCVETSGFAERKAFERIQKHVDLYLFDMKCVDDQAHIAYTGVSNQSILQNLEYLYQSGARILLRCPIIPGINDTDDHIQGIARLSEKYPNLEGVEIMPYHDMGKGKWDQLGMSYALPDLKTMDEDQKEALLERFLSAGCSKVSI